MPSGRITKKMYGTTGAPSGVATAWERTSSRATAPTIGDEPRAEDHREVEQGEARPVGLENGLAVAALDHDRAPPGAVWSLVRQDGIARTRPRLGERRLGRVALAGPGRRVRARLVELDPRAASPVALSASIWVRTSASRACDRSISADGRKPRDSSASARRSACWAAAICSAWALASRSSACSVGSTWGGGGAGGAVGVAGSGFHGRSRNHRRPGRTAGWPGPAGLRAAGGRRAAAVHRDDQRPGSGQAEQDQD